MPEQMKKEIKWGKWIFLFIILFQFIFLMIIIYIAKTAQYQSIDWRIIPAVFLLSCVAADIMLHSSRVQNHRRKEAEMRNEILNSELEEQLKHYEQITEHLERMAKFRHDFRNYMQTIYILIDRKSYEEAGELLSDLKQKLDEEEKYV